MVQEDVEGVRYDEDRNGGDRQRDVDGEAYQLRSFSEERARRGEELVRQELMSECTFKPKIKGLPQSYGATKNADAPFLLRVSQWKREKDKDMAMKKTSEEEEELERCTFKPHINRRSRRAALSRREALGERNLTVDDRLYDESIKRQAIKNMDRSQVEEDKKRLEEETLRKECTFKPSLSSATSKSAPREHSRYQQAAAAVAGRQFADGTSGGMRESKMASWREFEEFSFMPEVIGARPGMEQAKLYLKHDVVDRLTGLAFRPEGDEGLPQENQQQSKDSREGGTKGDPRWREALYPLGSGRLGTATAGNLRKVLNRQRHSQSSSSSLGRQATRKSFHAFLHRQNQLETRKHRKIQQMQAEEESSFQPTVCPESSRMHQSSNKGDFLQRVARDAARKEHEAVRQQARMKNDPACTFQPETTQRSKEMPARSVVELSRGDQLRRDTTQRLTKLRLEQELLVDVTFHPTLNDSTTAQRAVSALRVVSDPSSYLARVQVSRSNG
ncbi:unnamed protein product [Discosporangium mesarthrocarpum]